MMIVLILNSMETQFNEDCKKQNYQGIKSYWDVDIDCSQFYQIKERVTSWERKPKDASVVIRS